VCLALAFAMPLIAVLAAMSVSEIERPTAAQLRAKRTALLAVAAPTLFTFMGVVLYMLHNPVPDTWIWVACWALALALLLRSDNAAPVRLAVRPVPVPLRVAHGLSALALVLIFLALHIANHLMFPAGPGTYDAVMKVFRHVYRTDILQPLLVALFLFQVGTGLFFAWRPRPATASAPSRSPRASTSPFTCSATWTRSSFSRGPISASTPTGPSRQARPLASSRTPGTSASCHIIGSACSSS
jgi:hypothetical protein